MAAVNEEGTRRMAESDKVRRKKKKRDNYSYRDIA